MNGYRSDTHSKVMGYLMWILGFSGRIVSITASR
ncbi:hypothetical protein SAMN05444064_10838 [Pseudomonas syringae]|nr:hypothetical protein SAMN05444514_10838 [Pseudomonas syringae]SFM04612.1 hypothetical protein SAMN05444064_10838 [Pseudomonas syringae]